MFDHINIQQASLSNYNAPKSVWQILNHLMVWQAYQIKKLCNEATTAINEMDTWEAEKAITDQALLDANIATFKAQIEKVKHELSNINTAQKDAEASA